MEMDASAAAISRAENRTLTEQNLSLRQQIASLRNDRLELQYKLVETIRAKESFKTEVIKLITQAQNTFERLKTFIEHTTSTPPQPLLSGTEKLMRRQIVGGNQQQQQQRQHGIFRLIPILKDTQQIPIVQAPAPPAPPPPPPPPTPTPPSTTVQDENDDMHLIDMKLRKLHAVLKKYKDDVQKDMKKEEHEARRTTSAVTAAATASTEVTANVKAGYENRRYSKRLQSNYSISSPLIKQLAEQKNKKENLEKACPFKDVTNGAPMRLGAARAGKELVNPTTANRRGRKRKGLNI